MILVYRYNIESSLSLLVLLEAPTLQNEQVFARDTFVPLYRHRWEGTEMLETLLSDLAPLECVHPRQRESFTPTPKVLEVSTGS